ncbi:Reverse transcriptase RNA-dependent DNA polymerase [Arabidopsis suecica]|uniref:Reverse transcriptase RNA-dependent DNA polymerase n=1 Tax=Arabidopsis suecica TaxID=45249 RepID=A0A8T1XDA4_ARASU|nr:Reverse transcriptase RNA-dependent DNA polymerase [Arabidopsis suecica]
MIGRADIEGSKSNVAMNAWLPQASYPCGNFSDTSSFKFRRSKGSIGHAFTVRIRTENQNQTSFYPFVPHEISVLVELILGHLRYLLTDVPPQPNSPPDNVLRPDRPAEASLGSKNRGCTPPPTHGSFHKVGLESSSTGSSFPADSAKPVPLAVVSLDSRQGHRIPLVRTSSELTVRRPGKAPERAVPSPSPGRHAATRSRRGSSSSSPPTADGFGTGTPEPSPQSQSFSRSYGSILPTSLAYIVPSTRGCSPWRPDAVMSTTGRERHSVLRIFKGRRGRTGHHATCGALPAAGPYLRLSRFQDLHRRPLRPGSRPRFCSDRRALLLIEAWLLPRRPGIGRALQRHPFSGLVDSAVGHRNPASGSSRIASSAYQKWPTWSSRFRVTAQQSSRHNSRPSSSYPEGNFGGNQLLDGSISLSPLYPSQTNDLHVSMLTLEPFSEDQGRSAVHPRGIPPISFLAPYGFTHPLTRTHVRLLGPCFKTGRMGSPQADARSTQMPRHAVKARAADHDHGSDVSAGTQFPAVVEGEDDVVFPNHNTRPNEYAIDVVLKGRGCGHYNSSGRGNHYNRGCRPNSGRGRGRGRCEGIELKDKDKKGSRDQYCIRLNKSLYGLKQSGRMWYNRLSDYLVREGYKNDPISPCIFIKKFANKGFVIIAVYVDDLNILGTSGEIAQTVEYLKKEFEMKDLGKTKFCLGLQLEYVNNGILVHQKAYTEKVLKRFNMDQAHPLSSPMVVRSLGLDSDPFGPKKDEEEVLGPEVPYLSAIGALMYLASHTRPDICFAVNLLCLNLVHDQPKGTGKAVFFKAQLLQHQRPSYEDTTQPVSLSSRTATSREIGRSTFYQSSSSRMTYKGMEKFEWELRPGPSLRTLLQTTIRTPKTSDFQAGLFPVRSPLLRESLTLGHLQLPDRSDRQYQMDHVHHRMSGRSRRPWLGFRPTACGNTRETSFRPASAKEYRGRRFVTPRQTCPRPEGLGRNLRSKTRWFTGFCNSHQVSHFATFFIDARAEISVAESRFCCKTLSCIE